jgi:uncharacterized protein
VTEPYLTHVLLVLGVSLVGGAIRRLGGFGGALIMTPGLMWIFPLTQLLPIVMLAELFGGLWLSRQWKLDPDDRSRLYRFVLPAGLLLPIGIYVTAYLSPFFIGFLTSVVILIFSICLLCRPSFRLIANPKRDLGAGALSGLLLGTCGIGGPPAALYVNMAEGDFNRSRTLLSVFISALSFMAAAVAILMGAGVGWIRWFFCAAIGYGSGLWLGGFISAKLQLNNESIRTMCLVVLLVNALFNLGLLIFMNVLTVAEI